MRDNITPTTAGREYAAAYAAHYTQRDWPLAVQLYQKLLAVHPGEPEADYAWTQLQNIVRSVVPQQELLNAQLELLLVHSEHAGPPVTVRRAATASATAQCSG